MAAELPISMPTHCRRACFANSNGDEGDRVVCPGCHRVWKVKRGRWVHPSFLYRWLIEWWWLA